MEEKSKPVDEIDKIFVVKTILGHVIGVATNIENAKKIWDKYYSTHPYYPEFNYGNVSEYNINQIYY